MINWDEYTINQIAVMWENFNFTRTYPYKCTQKEIDDSFITCHDREFLIEYLLSKFKKRKKKKVENAQKD